MARGQQFSLENFYLHRTVHFDFSGNLDTAIALRTCVSKGTTAWVQAGAGVVVDSDPATEYDECVNKAEAVLRAIAASSELE